VGFITRRVVPRSVRRAAHPVRTLKRELTPNTIKNVRRSLSPIDNALYGVERKIFTKRGSGTTSNSLTYSHEGCDVAHRSPEATQNCRKGISQLAYPSSQDSQYYRSPCPTCGALFFDGQAPMIHLAGLCLQSRRIITYVQSRQIVVYLREIYEKVYETFFISRR
jgi:hypothetical protein